MISRQAVLYGGTDMEETKAENQQSDTGSTPDPIKDERRRVKRSYGVSTTAMIFQIIIINLLSIGGNVVFRAVIQSRVMAENPGATEEELSVLIDEAIRQGAALNTLISLVSATLALAVAIAFGYKMIRTFRFRDSLKRSRAKATPLGVVGILAVQTVSFLISIFLKTLAGTSGSSAALERTLSGDGDLTALIIAMIHSCILAALFEEFFFRGFMLNAMSPVSKWFAVIMSALMFALMHGNFGQFPNTFVIGILHGYVSIKCGTVIPNIIAHTLTNFMAFMGGFAGDAWGDTGYIIFFAAEFVIALPCLIIFIKKNGKIDNKTDIIVPDLNSEPPSKPENTIVLLMKCPSFWIVLLFELGSMISLLMTSMASAAA